jgi:hypothetical protein
MPLAVTLCPARNEATFIPLASEFLFNAILKWKTAATGSSRVLGNARARAHTHTEPRHSIPRVFAVTSVQRSN